LKITVVGAGYVGLVTAACFAESGIIIECIDNDIEKINKLKNGIVPIYEPGLRDLIQKNHNIRLFFGTDLEHAIENSLVIFIAVGTPPNEDGSADLSHVINVAEYISQRIKHDAILVLKSTVPVGTNKQIQEIVQTNKHRIIVVSNPEFLKEGDAINDFLKPDRIVIGTDDNDAYKIMRRVYSPFNRQKEKIMRMSPESAEIVKYASNALLASRVSFMNEMALLCDKVNADIEDVRLAMGADNRIGYRFLYPGLGFGGSCFPKDLRALVRMGSNFDISMQMSKAASNINQLPISSAINKIKLDIGDLHGKTATLWGLSFKPRTDDVREAPAIKLIHELIQRGVRVQCTDPAAIKSAKNQLTEFSGLEFYEDQYEACKGADILIIVTEWRNYRFPDVQKLRNVMKGRYIYDGRNCTVYEGLVEAGFTYRGFGRPVIIPSHPPSHVEPKQETLP
jgi:UDPglucose 6-dehydrogenase